MDEQIDVVIVGAGSAGLAVSHELASAGIAHIVLERGRTGQTWRDRWDSFCLVTPNWTVRLPGGEYEGPEPDGFMVRAELVAHLERYAANIGSPVREGVDVTALDRAPNGGLRLRTSAGDIESAAVVLATGAYQRPHRPGAADSLPAGLLQLDAEGYTNPGALPSGAVLIVGSGQTGCQLAEEIHEAGRDVFLACGRAPWAPRRIEGRDLFAWMVDTRFFETTLAELPLPQARLVANVQATGHGGGHDLHYRVLQAAGVNLLGHFRGADGHRASFASDLAESVAFGDARYNVSANWYNPLQLHDLNGLATGAALAVFFFWGWDTAANVNEESKDANESPGLAGIFSMFILLFIFLVAATAIQAFLSLSSLNDPNNQNDILYFFAQQISGTPVAYFMILAVLSSTVATTQTTLLPSSRLTYSMARDGVFPKAFGRVHRSWRTPWVGTIISSILAVVVIVLSVTLADSVGSIFSKLILDIGVLVALYYGITGISCAWAFRKVLLTSVTRFIFAGVLPLLGGLFLLAVAYAVIAPTSLPYGQAADWGTSLPIIITVALGVPLVIIAALTSRSTFFHEKTVSYVVQNGQLVAALAGGGTMELAGATLGGPPATPAVPVDPATRGKSSDDL